MIRLIEALHYRCLRDVSQELDEFHVLVGPNASGKTNLLEAILVVAIGKSFRARDPELIAFDKPWARLEAHTMRGERSVTLEQSGTAAKKVFNISGQTA